MNHKIGRTLIQKRQEIRVIPDFNESVDYTTNANFHFNLQKN